MDTVGKTRVTTEPITGEAIKSWQVDERRKAIGKVAVPLNGGKGYCQARTFTLKRGCSPIEGKGTLAFYSLPGNYLPLSQWYGGSGNRWVVSEHRQVRALAVSQAPYRGRSLAPWQ